MARSRKKSTITPAAGWAVYLRTSDEEAQNPEASQARQRYLIQKSVLDRSDLPVIDEYIDLLTGRTPRRIGYQRMLEDARMGRFSHVIVERADRFGRNDTEALRAIDELDEFGVSVRFANHKGGVGKSTSATNTALGIAGMLRRAGAPNARVLLIDTDSQAHATLVTTGTKDYGTDDSLYTVLMADRQNAAQTLLNCIVQSTWDADLHVLPASPMLEGAERELMGIAGAPYRLADPLSRIINRYAAVVIDTRPSFSLMTEMGLIAATDAIVPVEPRYLETVGLMSVIGKINDIREGWRQPNLRVSGILVTKMNTRIKGHNHLLDELKGHSVLGKLLLGVVPANESVSYAHQNHQSIFNYDPKAPASKAYAQFVGKLVQRIAKGGA